MCISPPRNADCCALLGVAGLHKGFACRLPVRIPQGRLEERKPRRTFDQDQQKENPWETPYENPALTSGFWLMKVARPRPAAANCFMCSIFAGVMLRAE